MLLKHNNNNEYCAEYGCRVLCDIVSVCLTVNAAGISGLNLNNSSSVHSHNSSNNNTQQNLLLPSTYALYSSHRDNSAYNVDTIKTLGLNYCANALCSVFTNHVNNMSVTTHCLTALDRLCYVDKNIPLLRHANICNLVVQAVQTHYTYSEEVVLGAYRLMTHLCYDDLCREMLVSFAVLFYAFFDCLENCYGVAVWLYLIHANNAMRFEQMLCQSHLLSCYASLSFNC